MYWNAKFKNFKWYDVDGKKICAQYWSQASTFPMPYHAQTNEANFSASQKKFQIKFRGF